MRSFAATVTTVLFIIATIIVVTKINERNAAVEDDRVLTLEEINYQTALRENQKEFREALAYLDEHYPNRTVGEEIELLEMLLNPVLIVDNGPGEIGIYDPTDTQNPGVAEMPQVVGTITVVSVADIAEVETDSQILENEAKISEVEPVEEPAKEFTFEFNSNDVELATRAAFVEVEEFLDDQEGDTPFESEYLDSADGETCYKAVISTMVNRKMENEGFFPDTIYGVLHQGEGTKQAQYAPGTLKKMQVVEPPEKAYRWTEEVFREGSIGPSNLVFQANFIQGDEVWLKYGNMYFCTTEKIPE